MTHTLDTALPLRTFRYTAKRFNYLCYALAFCLICLSLKVSLTRHPIEGPSWEKHDFSQFYMGGLIAKNKAWDALYPIPHAGSVNSPGEWEESDVKPEYARLAEEAGVPEQSSRYIQPPPFALALKYLTYLKYGAAKKMWLFIMALSAWSVAVLAGLSYEWCAGRRSRLAGCVALLIAISPLTLETQRLMNITPFIAALIGFAIMGLLQRHSEGGALAIAEGAAAKYATAILLPMYVVMRKWRALIVLAVVTIGILVYSFAMMGRGPFEVFFREMLPTFSRVHTDPWNRCLPAVVMHAIQAAHHADRSVPLGGAAKWLVRVLQWGSLIGLLVLIFKRPVESWRHAPNVLAGSAALLVWFLIFSPILWDHYFMYLMPVWGWLVWEARRSWWRAVIVVAVIEYQCLPDSFIDQHAKLAGPYGSGMLIAAVLMLALAVIRFLTPSPLYSGERAGVRGATPPEGTLERDEEEPLAPTLSPAYRGEGEYSFNTIQFNRACAILGALWLLFSIPLKTNHWSLDEDFPQFYMGGVMARAGAWDSLYPIPKPDSLNNAGLPEDSTQRPRYAEEAKRHEVRDGTYFIQPPPVAIMLEPLSFLSYHRAFQLWILVSVVCAWGVSWMAGAGYELLIGRRSMVAGVLLLLVAVSPLMQHAVLVANMTVMVAVLVGVAVIGLARGADATSAGATVLGGAFKYTTAPLLPLMLVMRRWKAIILAVLFTAALCGGTLAITGKGPFRTYITEIFPTFSRAHHLETNQSITAFLQRITHHPVLPTGVKIAITAVEALTFFGLIWLMIRVPREAWKRPLNVFAASMALLAFLLCFSPIFWEHYPVYLCPLWGYLAWEAGQSWRRFALVVVAVLLTYAPLTLWYDLPEPLNTHILPSALLMMALGAWRVSRAAEEAAVETPLYHGWFNRPPVPEELMAAVRFNRVCRLIAVFWLLIAVPVTFKIRPPRFHDFGQFYMGGVIAKNKAWDALYPIPHPQSIYNPGLADDSDMRPKYAELAEKADVGDQPRFIQMPPAAVAYEPFAFLRYHRAYWVWMGLQCACALGISLMAGRFYELSAGRTSKVAGVITLVAGCSYLMYTTVRALNQEALISLLLGLAMMELAGRAKRAVLGGLATALGTVLKYANVILLPIAIAARRWTMVIPFAVGLFIAIGGTMMITGRGPFTGFGHIAPLLTRPYEDEGNQSITALMLRVGHRTPPLPMGTTVGIRIAGAVTLLVLLGLIFRRRPRDWEYPPLVFAASAGLICWLLAFSPLTWNKYFLYLVPLWGWMAWEATRSHWRLVLVVLALVATWGPWEEIERLHLREPLTSHMLWGLALTGMLAVARLLAQRDEGQPLEDVELAHAAARLGRGGAEYSNMGIDAGPG